MIGTDKVAIFLAVVCDDIATPKDVSSTILQMDLCDAGIYVLAVTRNSESFRADVINRRKREFPLFTDFVTITFVVKANIPAAILVVFWK